MIPWTLTGTDRQKAVAAEAFNRIKFPFERLTLPGTPELGWRDLNGDDEWWLSAKVRGHKGHTEKPDSLEGEFDGRKWTMGVIFTSSGRILIDQSLVNQPEVAMATIGAEIAHAVDFFLPMTDAMRDEFLRLWNVPGSTWWEVNDYSAEYFRLGGEAFMHEFVAAYSELDFGSTGAFAHDVGVDPADTRRILGIDRTDYVKPPTLRVVRYGKSKIYHRISHYDRPGVLLTNMTGFRPCKQCKPGDV